MNHEIEKRAYGPNSTDEELSAIRNRLSYLGGGVILYVELPVVSEFSVDVCFDTVDEMIRVHDAHTFLVDLQNAGRPDAAARERLHKRISGSQKIRHLATVTGKNALINVALRFILAGMLDIKTTVFRTIEEAKQELLDVR